MIHNRSHAETKERTVLHLTVYRLKSVALFKRSENLLASAGVA